MMLMMDEEKRETGLDIFIARMPAVILGSFIVEYKFRSHSPTISKRKVKFPHTLTFSTKNKFLLGY